MLAIPLLFLLQATKPDPTVIEQLKQEAAAVQPLIQTKLAKDWLSGVDKLGEPKARVVYRTPAKEYLTEAAYKALSEKDQAAAKKVELAPDFFYYTKYGTPLAYVRIYDLAAKNGLADLKGKAIADYGYGGIGQLRLSALMGAKAVGIDVDSLLPALYSDPADAGTFGGGFVQMVNGFWPGGEGVAAKVGDGYDLFISKNTLKRGYVHPERPANPNYLINLGVTDEEYLRAVWKALKPGGLFIVYNLSPAQNPPDKEFLPMADGRFPFDTDLSQKVGFDVLAFDVNDDDFAQAMGLAYGWGTADEMKKTIFAHYTIMRKR
jgi:SAM-dependent methyltransferase